MDIIDVSLRTEIKDHSNVKSSSIVTNSNRFNPILLDTAKFLNNNLSFSTKLDKNIDSINSKNEPKKLNIFIQPIASQTKSDKQISENESKTFINCVQAQIDKIESNKNDQKQTKNDLKQQPLSQHISPLLNNSSNPHQNFQNKSKVSAKPTMCEFSKKYYDLQQFNLKQKKISYAIQKYFENFKNLSSKEKRIFQNELMHANMCLRLVGLRREIVETESSHSQTQTHKPKINIDINKGCLVIRQIVIPLRRSSSQVYLFLVVRNHFQIFNSIPLIAKSNSSYLEFTINGIFEQLEPSFQIKVETYQMDLTTMQATLMKPIYKSLWNKTKPNNWWKCTKKLKSALSKQNQLEVVPNNTYNFEIRSVQKIETDKLAIVGSAFKLVGSFILDRNNWQTSPQILGQFDCTWGVIDDRIAIDCNVSIDYGPEIKVDKPMALSITLRSLHSTTSINVDQLTFKKSELKFNRGNMLIYDRWMQWKSKRQMIKLDFANCINSLVESNFMKKFREQNNVICLVFGVPIKSQSKQSFENSFTLEDFGTNQYDFKFVFLTCEAINLKQFYSKIMARIHIARYWYQIAHDTKESQMFCEKQFKIISENLRLT